VFGAGTVQWAWGLDDTNGWASAGAPAGSTPDPNMQQATVNLFADMGVQPTTLISGLVPATQSIDTSPPTSMISSPSPGANVSDGSQVTVTGTASDSGGGVVAGVEISTDGGKTWHPTTMTTPAQQSVNWTYTWIAHGNPSTTLETRAVDDSGNLETPSDGISVNVGCPCSLWSTSITPATAVPGDPGSVNDSGDATPVTVGVKFTSDTFGQVSGIRFYKASANTGTHIGSVWTSSGQLLASATFTGETASGWQTVTFSNPVTILPNTTYVAGYYAPNGHYSATPNYFYPAPAPTPLGGATLNSSPLHAVPNTRSSNGLFTYGAANTFPSDTNDASNYWVDVSFAPAPSPGQAAGVHATAGNGAVFVTWSAPTTGGPPTSYTVTPYIGTTALTPTTVNGTPPATGTAITGLSSGTSYTFTVTASNPNGSGPASAASNAVIPSTASSTPAFVQQVTGHTNAASLSVTPTSNLTVGNRMVVLVGVWSSSAATAASVTDSAGDTYVELAHWTASENTEMSVWSAPIWSGGGTRPTITVKPSSSADVGVAASEYSGLSAVNDATVVDQSARATGTTGSAATVSSGATAATTAGNELAIGVYADSGFGDTLTAGSGWTQRSNISNAGDMELLSEDQLQANTGAKPSASVGTGASTTWQVAAIVLKGAPQAAPTAPGPPTGVTATAGNGSATVSWTAPPDGGSPITSYTVTPYIGTQAQLPTTIIGSPPATNTTITGLTNGTAYTFKVTATNMIGTGQSSAASNSVSPAAPTVPGTPTGVSATGGNGSATVSWTAPGNGGSQITSYTITPYIGTQAQAATTINGSPPATNTTITGLANGTSYTFTVAAANVVGSGPASSPSNAVTPTGPTVPGAPTGVTATAGLNSATVSWTAPSSNGSPITSYTITPYIGTQAQTATTINGSPPATNTTITGLAGGTAYTFTVTATNGIGIGPASSPSNSVTPTSPSVPAAPTGVTATPSNASATVSWTAPNNGGSQILSYTITPYIGSQAQTATTINGSPPATNTTVTGLTNGTSYTFTVTAANAIGTGPASTASNAVTPSAAPAPTFIQQVTAHKNATSVTVVPTSNITAGNRIIVLVGVWSSGNASAKTVTDTAGNTYTEIQHFKASENTELSVWTAQISAGGGTKPTITVTPTAKADVGVAAAEYSGLSTASGAAAVDQLAQGTGTTGLAGTVSSAATPTATAGGELAMGFYVDSGFGDALTAGGGWTSRVNVSNASDMELLVEDQPVGQGATPSASAGTGASTTWLMSTVVFKHG
jgi:hypothetical protein